MISLKRATTFIRKEKFLYWEDNNKFHQELLRISNYSR